MTRLGMSRRILMLVSILAVSAPISTPPAEAMTLFAAALELNPRDPAILAGRAECQEADGNLAEATSDYRRALEILLGAR